MEVLEKSTRNRVVITLVGIPGAGKSTIATKVVDLLNSKSPGIAAAVGMDGFHYSRAQLDDMDDPATAHRRRGAAFTFDASGVVGLFSQLHDSSRSIEVPTFDHALKDPIQNGAVIEPEARIVIVEGLYLQLDLSPWNQIAEFEDAAWFIDVDENLAIERLAARHVASTITPDLESGYARARENDIPNGHFILEHGRPAIHFGQDVDIEALAFGSKN